MSPLHAASQDGHPSIVEVLIGAGATVDLQAKVNFVFVSVIVHDIMKVVHVLKVWLCNIRFSIAKLLYTHANKPC